MYDNNINHALVLKILWKNIFPHTFYDDENCWNNIFFRPEEAMLDNWQKLVSLIQNVSCSREKSYI